MKSVEDLTLFIVVIESTLRRKGNPHPRRRMTRPLRRPALRNAGNICEFAIDRFPALALLRVAVAAVALDHLGLDAIL